MIEITRLTKRGGPLTKRIFLGKDNHYRSDGSACVMSEGEACRIMLSGVQPLAELIEQSRSDEALALGAMRPDLPDRVRIVAKNRLNGAAHPDVIARNGDAIAYRAGLPAFALLDFDTKGMPAEIAARLEATGGYWPALLTVLPEFDVHSARRAALDLGRALPHRHGGEAGRVLRPACLRDG